MIPFVLVYVGKCANERVFLFVWLCMPIHFNILSYSWEYIEWKFGMKNEIETEIFLPIEFRKKRMHSKHFI